MIFKIGVNYKFCWGETQKLIKCLTVLYSFVNQILVDFCHLITIKDSLQYILGFSTSFSKTWSQALNSFKSYSWSIRTSRSQMFFEIGAMFKGKPLVLESLFNKVAEACNFIRKGLLQHKVFSCEYYEIFKSTFFTEHILWLLLWWEPPAMISLCTKYARKRVFTDLYSHIFYAELALNKA